MAYGVCDKCGRDTVVGENGICYSCDYEELRKKEDQNATRRK